MHTRFLAMTFAVLTIGAPFATALASGQDPDSDAPARAVVADVLANAAVAKLAVSEHFVSKHEWVADAAAIGYASPDNIPATISIAEGTITIAFKEPEVLAGKVLRLVPKDGGGDMVRWNCEAPDFPAELAPKGCR